MIVDDRAHSVGLINELLKRLLLLLHLLLMLLLLHDHAGHLLLHLNYGLGVEETIGEVKDILTLKEEGHKAALIRVGEMMRLDSVRCETFFVRLVLLAIY